MSPFSRYRSGASGRRLRRRRAHRPQQAGDLRVVLDDVGEDERPLEVAGDRHDAVAGEQDGGGAAQRRRRRGAQLRAARWRGRGDPDRADVVVLRLLDRRRERHAEEAPGDGVRTVRVNDRGDVGARPVDREVQRELARRRAAARDPLPVEVDGDEVLLRHGLVRDARRRDEDAIALAHAEVSDRAADEPARRQATAAGDERGGGAAHAGEQLFRWPDRRRHPNRPARRSPAGGPGLSRLPRPPMSKPAHTAPSAARRVRRRLARWLAPQVEAELRETRRKLKATRSQLRRAREEAAYDLPPELEQTIARAREEHLTYLKPNHLRDLASI